MKKIFSLALFLFLFSFTQAKAESISNFSVDIKINKDASVFVTESIAYDFGSLQRHGIYRFIPYRYKARGGTYKLNFSQISVTDEFGNPYKFFSNYKDGNLYLKIGQEDKLVTGQHIYIIKYKVERAVNYFSDHDEFYWNVTGNGWPVPIEKAVARVYLPRPLSVGDLSAACFIGVYGSDKECQEKKVLSQSAEFFSGNLSANEGLTIVLGWPKGIVYEPTWWENLFFKVKDNLILFLPLFVLVIMFGLWWKKGRDPKGRGVIIPRYSPPDNLTPVEVGTIVDERVNRRDTVSIIIDLAVRGYLKITRVEEKNLWRKKVDYELEQVRPADKSLKFFEMIFLDGLFRHQPTVAKYIGFPDDKKILLSDLKGDFYSTINEVEKSVYAEVAKSGYFSKNPNEVRFVYFGIAIAFVVLGFFAARIWGQLYFLSFLLSGLIIGFFGLFMPRKTSKGVRAYEHILGLKEYLQVAEKDRLKFHNSPQKNPKLFEKLLPYAMVLKVEKEWAEQFKDIYKQPPSWYNDPSISVFNIVFFMNSLHSFSTSAASVLNFQKSSASAGGSGFSGGFSGGGFGGGGGGSW